MADRLSAAEAKALIKRIREDGSYVFSSHSRDELAKDGLTSVDVDNVLRAGVVREAEFENGSWRYRVETQRMCVVVAFNPDESALRLVVVTAWRLKR